MSLSLNFKNIFYKQKKRKEIISFLYQGFQEGIHFDSKGEFVDIPKYKFYGNLIELLFQMGHQFGHSIAPILRRLRKELIKENKMELKLQNLYFSGFFQLITVSLIVWILFFNGRQYMHGSSSYIIMWKIIFLHIIGLFAYIVSYYCLKKTFFEYFEQYFYSLYILYFLLLCKAPFSVVIAQSNIKELKSFKNHWTELIRPKLYFIVESQQNFGLGADISLEDLLEELWNFYDLSMQKLEKSLIPLRFTILILFYLSSYFLYLYSILDYMM